jgi:trehalose 6-phosphate phosphatase
VRDRERAAMRATTRTLFAKVCQLYPCAVISGRPRGDVTDRLAGIDVGAVVGNHGLEPGPRVERFARVIATVRPVLESALDGTRGVDIEDKRYSLALHYRNARRRGEARAAIQRAVLGLPLALRVVPGKLVVNLVPPAAPNKADALIGLRERHRADTAFYVGDDATDEDVFALDQPGRLLSVRIGRSSNSAARYYLKTQREIDSLLSRLIAFRSNGVHE